MKNILVVVLFSIVLFHSGKAQWEADVRLTNDPGDSRTTTSHSWCVASSGSIVHVTWYDDRNGNLEIYYKRSTNDGLTWGNDIRMTNNNGRSQTPSIAVSGSIVHIVWCDNAISDEQIFYIRSTDNGLTWGNIAVLVDNSGNFIGAISPSLSTSGSNLHMLWTDSRDFDSEIYYKRSTNNGISWGSDIRLTNDPQTSGYPSVASSGNNIHIVWHDKRDGQEEIYYKRSTNNGSTWGSETRLSAVPNSSSFPCIAVSSQAIHVVWQDIRTGTQQMYYKKSTNNGTNWSSDIPITNDAFFGEQPSIAVSGQVVHMSWSESGALGGIYYTRSQDIGANWESKTRLTSSFALAKYSSMSLSGTIIHLVWHDGRNGAYEIYYKRNVSGNVLPVEMAYLNSSVKENNITINWGTSWELNNSGFNVERRNADGNDWQAIGFVHGYGTVNEEKQYVFRDNNLIKGKYQYRLKQIDYNGNFEYHLLPGEVTIGAPGKFEILQNYPNPSNPKSKIDFHLPFDAQVTLKVYDITGKEAAVLVNGFLESDYHSAEFDGSNLSSGVYFYRITAVGIGQKFSKTLKMILVK